MSDSSKIADNADADKTDLDRAVYDEQDSAVAGDQAPDSNDDAKRDDAGEEGYGDEYADEEGYGDEYADEEGYGDEYADEEGYGDEYADEEGYGDEYADEEGYGAEQDDAGGSASEKFSHPLVQDLMLNPSRWRIWPAIAVMRWLLRKMEYGAKQMVYRSNPTLNFCPSEIHDIAIGPSGMEAVLNAPGIATPGSLLPTADIERIIRDNRRGGALAKWLDGPGDRFMQALELSRSRNNAAFSLATGGHIEALRVISNLVGRSVPLSATKGGALHSSFRNPPEGATGLAGLFVGAASASGLVDLFRSFVNLPIQLKEFAGAEVLVLRPARVGRPLGLILGSKCKPASAGIDIIIEGGKDTFAQRWARESERRRSLHLLASSYIGSPTPEARIFLQLDRRNVSPSVLDGNTVIGGLAVMGPPNDTVMLPIHV